MERRASDSSQREMAWAFGLVIVFLALSLIANWVRAGVESEIQILRVGDFHGSEVARDPGSGWYGLFPAGDGFELRRVRVSVESVPDAISDLGQEKTGRGVRIDSQDSPIVLVRGLPGLAERRTPTVVAKPRFFFPGERLPLNLHSDRSARGFSLTAYGNVDRPPDSQPGATRIYAYRLVLAAQPWHDEDQQTIVDLHGLDEDSPPRVIWAGDLDGDHAPDLLMEVGNHYNVQEYTLFLSSAAQAKELVRKVARFRTVGC